VLDIEKEDPEGSEFTNLTRQRNDHFAKALCQEWSHITEEMRANKFPINPPPDLWESPASPEIIN
jgi:hypothetical protein